MKIVAVTNIKGGVGKTTTAVNLAAALAARGRRVLLVDLDSQASASLSLGVARENLAPSSADVLLSGLPARQAVRPTSVPGLDLVTASVDLVHVDGELASYRSREGRLKSALAGIAHEYEHVFLDCASSLSLLPVNALVAANAFIAPVVPQFLALTGLKNLIGAAERLGWDGGTRVRLLGVLLTMVDYRTRATRRNVDELRGEYGSRVFAMEIRVNTRLAEAPEAGRTIFQYDPKATGAEAYRLLAEEFLLRSSELDRKEAGLPPESAASEPGLRARQG
jgi:chromosome partitioning protein